MISLEPWTAPQQRRGHDAAHADEPEPDDVYEVGLMAATRKPVATRKASRQQREQCRELDDSTGDGWRRLPTPTSSSPVPRAARGGGREAQQERAQPTAGGKNTANSRREERTRKTGLRQSDRKDPRSGRVAATMWRGAVKLYDTTGQRLRLEQRELRRQ